MLTRGFSLASAPRVSGGFRHSKAIHRRLNEPAGCGVARQQGTRTGRRGATTAPAPQATFNPFLSNWAGQPDNDEPRMRSIFQPAYLPPLHNSPTVEDARDALETCRGLTGEAKTACYAVFNCEPQNVEQYYEVVSLLESALVLETDPEEEALHHGQERC